MKIVSKKEWGKLQARTKKLEIEILKLNNPPKYKLAQRIKKGKYIIIDMNFTKGIDIKPFGFRLKIYYYWQYEAINNKTGKKITFSGKQLSLD